MNRRSKRSDLKYFFSKLSDDGCFMIDVASKCVYDYIELPLQDVWNHLRSYVSYRSRQRNISIIPKNVLNVLVQSYLITFVFYFILLFFAQLFSIAIQRYYFIDPFLSNNRQCINIQFVKINHRDSVINNTLLKDNFIRENVIVGNESVREYVYKNYTQLYQLLDILQNYHYTICQRSLYIHARFHTYTKLLHSNQSHFRFLIPKYPFSFSIDQVPFLDLCVHTSNRSQTEQIRSNLSSLSSYSYTSINLYFFKLNFTEVSVTIYQLDTNSIHLERLSIHTGWLLDVYSQIQFYKYNDALSTVLFDGFAKHELYVDYFNYTYIPVPADSLLGLNEMIQRTLLVLPLCQTTNKQ